MLLNPEAFVHAEIDRRLEHAGAYQWHLPSPAPAHRPALAEHLRSLFHRPLTAGMHR